MLDFGQIWAALQQGVADPALADATADALARTADPAMMAPLVSGQPTDFSKAFSGAQLGGGQPQFAGAPAPGLGTPPPQFAGTPVPSINVGGPGEPPPPQPEQKPMLSAEQQQMLLKMMQPTGQTVLPPPASPGRPQPFNAQMKQLQAGGSPAAAPRPTLGQLIYGR